MKRDEIEAKQKEAKASLDKWEKEVLPTIDLQVLDFPNRIIIQEMIEQGVANVRVCAEAASLGLTGKFIKGLEEDDLKVFRQYSDKQIMAIGGRVIEVSGNPTTD